MREHRLYHVDFLLRKYGFADSEIVFDSNGNLSLSCDPKEAWAKKHPERFPINVNHASKFELLRVPGIGLITAKMILGRRKVSRIRHIEQIGKVGARLEKTGRYLVF